MKHEKHFLIDNLGILKTVRDVLGKSSYSEIIGYWGSNDYDAITKLIDDWSKTRKSAWDGVFVGEILSNEFVRMLKKLRSEFNSFMDDDLYDIYIGLDHTHIKEASEYDCRLKPYFIFRCGNNGRTDLITFE